MAADVDETALEIVLNVIHLKKRRVPKIVNVELLARIAVLVDYYECAEAVEAFSSIWETEVFKSDSPRCLFSGRSDCRHLTTLMYRARLQKIRAIQEDGDADFDGELGTVFAYVRSSSRPGSS